MGNDGLIYAVDIHPERFEAMKNFLQLTDVKCVEPVLEDYFSVQLPVDDIKYVLIDPTSTYSGIFCGATRGPQKAKIQRSKFALGSLLRHTLQNYTSVKRIIFTTCSLFPEEGEQVVAETLEIVGNSYTLLNVKEMLWNEWESMSPPEYPFSEKCLRTIPEFDLCQGYFVAVFERNFDVPVPKWEKRIKSAGKTYTIDEMEKVEKINAFGELTYRFVPKEKMEDYKQNQLVLLERKMQRAREKKLKLLAQQKWNPDLMKWKKQKKKESKMNSGPNANRVLLPTPAVSSSSSVGLVQYPNQNLMTRPRQNLVTQSNINFMSESNRDFMSESNLDFMSESDQDCMPEPEQNFMPEPSRNFRSEQDCAYLSESEHNYPSQSSQSFRPEPDRSFTLHSERKYVPQNYRPEPSRNVTQASEQNYTSRSYPSASESRNSISQSNPNPGRPYLLSSAYPNIRGIASKSNFSNSDRIYETTHSQLYP